jgi:hypothetical protein
MSLPGKYDLFGATTPSTSALGLLVALPRACQCGSGTGVVGSSAGPHAAKVVCAQCGRFNMWLSTERTSFINSVIDTVGGRPAAPIILRHSREGT